MGPASLHACRQQGGRGCGAPCDCQRRSRSGCRRRRADIPGCTARSAGGHLPAGAGHGTAGGVDRLQSAYFDSPCSASLCRLAASPCRETASLARWPPQHGSRARAQAPHVPVTAPALHAAGTGCWHAVCLRSTCVGATLTRRACSARRRGWWLHTRRAGQMLGPCAAHAAQVPCACSQACRLASSCGRSGTIGGRTGPGRRSAAFVRQGLGSLRGTDAARTYYLWAARLRLQQACRCAGTVLSCCMCA